MTEGEVDHSIGQRIIAKPIRSVRSSRRSARFPTEIVLAISPNRMARADPGGKIQRVVGRVILRQRRAFGIEEVPDAARTSSK